MAGAARDLFNVSGQSVIITGATGALGGAAARGLAERGAKLTLAGGNAKSLHALAEELNAGDRVTLIERRPDTQDDAAAIAEAAVKAYGRIDGLLVASGMNKVAPIVDMPVTDCDAVMDANVKGSWLMCQAAGRVFKKQGRGGSVVLVSSTRGKLGHPAGYAVYCASKAAVDLMAKSLAAEWGANGTRVNVIAPTVFRSELTAWMYGDDEKAKTTREGMLSRIPLGRLAEPDDFVGALVFLLGDASSFMTGQVLYLDGGYTSC